MIFDGRSSDFYRAKLLTANFFISRMLPQQFSLKQAIYQSSACMMNMSEEQF